MARAADGVFTARAEAAVAPVGSDYVYLLPGVGPRPDPVSRHQPAGVHGPSRVVAPGAFRWSDAGWRGLPLGELVFYELHVGTFTPEGTFAGVAAQAAVSARAGRHRARADARGGLPRRPQLGLRRRLRCSRRTRRTAAPTGCGGSSTPATRTGSRSSSTSSTTTSGRRGTTFSDFGPYFTDRYRTPWGDALNFDGPDSDEVRRFFVDNALHWLTRVPRRRAAPRRHPRHLRLRRRGTILAGDGRRVPAPRRPRLGRRAWLVAESDLNDPRVIRPPEVGGLGLDAQWSDDFHHALHVLLTGKRRGYFVDFGRVGRSRQGHLRGLRLRRAARPRSGGAGTALPRRADAGERFVAFNQNHDQIANACQGRRLGQMVGPERQKLAATVLFSTPALPLLFQGEEYAEEAPFDYFTSHGDPALAEAVRQGRHAGVPAPARGGRRRRGLGRSAGRGDLPAREAALGRRSSGRRTPRCWPSTAR